MHGSEEQEQRALIRWAELSQSRYPELALLFHPPNGGLRSKAVAAKLKAQGVKAGVLDLVLPVARGPYHGLFIEMKVGKNKPTDMQVWWIKRLRHEGYAVEVCYGWEAAKDVLENYLNQEEKK